MGKDAKFVSVSPNFLFPPTAILCIGVGLLLSPSLPLHGHQSLHPPGISQLTYSIAVVHEQCREMASLTVRVGKRKLVFLLARCVNVRVGFTGVNLRTASQKPLKCQLFKVQNLKVEDVVDMGIQLRPSMLKLRLVFRLEVTRRLGSSRQPCLITTLCFICGNRDTTISLP